MDDIRKLNEFDAAIESLFDENIAQQPSQDTVLTQQRRHLIDNCNAIARDDADREGRSFFGIRTLNRRIGAAKPKPVSEPSESQPGSQQDSAAAKAVRSSAASSKFFLWSTNMYSQFHKSILISSVALAIVVTGNPLSAKTVSQDVTDARQETQIWTTYALSPYLRANDLKVAVHNGKAVLSGKVEEDVNKDLAKQIALGVKGIKEVDNQILVEADYKAPARTADRSYGEVIDDATVTAAVKSKLLWSKNTNGLAPEVMTKSGKVSLLGTADTAASKELASRLAMNTRGVTAVDNQLVIKGAPLSVADSAKNSAHEAGQEIADSWITTKVKSTYAYSSNVDASDIAVTTKSGIVTLSGIVDSGAERALAIEFAQNVRGVKSVQSVGLTTK